MSISKDSWRPRRIKLVATDERLTDATGLGTMVEVFDVSPLSKPFAESLPKRTSPRSYGSYRLGLIQLSSFLYGHDSLDDLDEFRDDPTLEEVMKGETVAPRTMGDFLRDFEPTHIESLNRYLAKMAWSIRGNLEKALPEEYRPKVPHFSIDSTSHPQTGEKMEGVAWNYKNEWCLDSQVIFDELGLSAGMQLRSGNTKSGVGAGELIEQAFSPYGFTDEKWLSGDAAYCNQEVMTTSLRLGAKFTLTANEATTGWERLIGEITNWQPWRYSEKEEEKAKSREKALPQVEVGSCQWQPGWSDVLRFTLVVKRTWETSPSEGLFPEEAAGGRWRYYGVMTNFSTYWKSAQEIVEIHNRRGNAENFIREEKYGYDLKHFPCQKLMANHAFGLIAMVAHNLLRWVAIIERPHKPHFSKKLRRRFIFIPGKVVRHARQIILKVSRKAYEEVTRLKKAWTSQPCPSFGIG